MKGLSFLHGLQSSHPIERLMATTMGSVDGGLRACGLPLKRAISWAPDISRLTPEPLQVEQVWRSYSPDDRFLCIPVPSQSEQIVGVGMPRALARARRDAWRVDRSMSMVSVSHVARV